MTLPITSVLAKTLYDYRRLAIAWGIGIFLLVLMYASFFPSIASSPSIGELFDNLPAAFRAIVGDTAFYATPSGFINAEVFSLTFPILLGILSITIGSALISKEDENGTLELLLARPVSRSDVLRQKVLGMLLVITIIALAAWLAVALGSLVIRGFDISLLRTASVTLMAVLLAWAFGFFALLLATLRGQRGLGIGVATVWFVVSYVINLFAGSVQWVSSLKSLSLFEYYQSSQVFDHGLRWQHVLILAGASIVLYALAEAAFRHRDIGA